MHLESFQEDNGEAGSAMLEMGDGDRLTIVAGTGGSEGHHGIFDLVVQQDGRVGVFKKNRTDPGSIAQLSIKRVYAHKVIMY